MAKRNSQERDEAIAQLREWIKPGDTVYTILDHVSSSGMSRAIRVVLPIIERHQVPSTDRKTGAPLGGLSLSAPTIEFIHPNYAVGQALGLRHWKRQGREQDALVLGGCGMDMGYHIVYSLSRVLFADGFDCLGQGCPSNDHSNGDRNYAPHRHSDPGYALKHRWL